jgi:hypothetical protein
MIDYSVALFPRMPFTEASEPVMMGPIISRGAGCKRMTRY